MILGIDGCRAGWVAASIDRKNKIEITLFRNITELWERFKKANLIFIDMPIGLIDAFSKEKVRNCDVEARKILGPKRGSSIFPAPSREATCALNYKDACRENRLVTGRKISMQTWNISKKIKEVDNFLLETKKANYIIKESHPEVCFYALSGSPMVFSKKNINGIFERKNVLKKFIPDLDFILERGLLEYNKGKVNINIDDLLDCLALAVSAELAFKSGNISRIPEIEQIDSKGFVMEISYFEIS
jgi:predicted RNase H-like nuclease